MTRGNMRMIDTSRPSTASLNKSQVDTAMEELIRRAKLQASELSLLIQRLERLRHEIRQHLDHGSPRS